MLFMALACVSQPEPQAPSWPSFDFPDSITYAFPYDLKSPDKSWVLPKKLDEVSGLGLNGDQGLVMVQDEKGRLFEFDFAADSVTGYTKFAKKGDYEAVERVGDLYYALTSDGKLFEIKLEADTAQTTAFPTGIPASYDLEGMTYHPGSGQLWILPKGDAVVNGKPNARYRQILAYDLTNHKPAEKPVTRIDLAEILSWMKQHPEGLEKAIAKFDPADAFHPSGIALHPQTGHIYMISSAGKLMVILDPDTFRVVGAQRLGRKGFSQPEGICFDDTGNLYISNEARDDVATLIRFAPIKQ